MGWLWSNGSNPETETSAPFDAAKGPDNSQPPDNGSVPDRAAPPKRTRDEQADAELQELMKELNYAPSEYPPASIPSPSASNHHSAPSSSASSTTRALRPTSTSPIDPIRLLPTSMSCRAAFDQAYHCQLPGGQLAHVYRYGGMRNCSELWSNFWFCMRTNRGFMTDEERGERIRRHYWKREEKYRSGPSSRDVWTIRGDLEEGAFQGNWAEVDKEFAEQAEKMERERREAKVGTGHAD